MILKYLFPTLVIVSGFATFILGYSSFEAFNFTPGAQGIAPAKWPTEIASDILDEVAPTLMVFVHPKCVCSHASLVELRKIAEKASASLRIKIFYEASETDKHNAEQMISEHMQGLNNTESFLDQDGKLASIFGAKTSGQTYLYSRIGDLLFQGGITVSRGHEGENEGSRTILKLVGEQNEAIRSAAVGPTFGCGL